MAWQGHYGYHGGHGTGVVGSIYDFKHPRAPSIPESTLLAMNFLFFPLSYQLTSVLLCYPPPPIMWRGVKAAYLRMRSGTGQQPQARLAPDVALMLG